MERLQENPLLLPAIPIVLTIIFLLGAAASIYRLQAPSNLPPPTRTIAPSTQDLGAILTLSDTNRPALIERNLRMPWRDIPNFHRHLEVAALQQGWYAYPLDIPHSDDANIIMPAEELPALDALEADPIAWVTKRTQNPTEARGPSSLNLVKVRVVTIPTNQLQVIGWMATAVVCAVIGLLFLVCTGYVCSSVYKNRAKTA